MSLSFDTTEAVSLLSYDCHRSVPAPFLTKTYYLVNDPATDDIVSWGEDNTTFVVWRPPEFARDLLPNYFKHNNFSSFVRQLNTYVSSSSSSFVSFFFGFFVCLCWVIAELELPARDKL
jgi:heat shock transcription factor